MKNKIFFLFIILFLISSCSIDKNHKTKIMFIPKSMNSTFWEIVVEGFEAATVEYNVYSEVRYPKTEEDYVRQIEIIEEAINENFDAIILSAIHYEYLVNVVEKALNKGIEVVIIDSDVNEQNIKTRISTNNYNAGYKMGEQTAKDINFSGTVGLLMVDKTAKNDFDRMQGYINALSQYSNIKIVHNQNTLPDMIDAEENTLKIIEMHPDITALATYNEITTMGMGQAIEKSKRDDIYCIGFDNNTILVDYLEQGIFDSLIVQNQFAMGYLGCEYAIKLLHNKSVSSRVDTGVHVITKETMFTSKTQTILFPFEEDITNQLFK